MEKDYENSINFWNQFFNLSEELKEKENKELKEEDWEGLAPSSKVLEAIKDISNSNNLLDYGCGNGWASICASKYGAKNITAVDMANNAKESVDFYADIFKAKGITAKSIDDKWLDLQNDIYDAAICFNVLDVIPEEVTDNILKGLYKALKMNAKLIISMNYYIDLTKDNKGFEIKNDRYIFINGILRLASFTDDEWINKLSKYFKVLKLEHFSWPGEEVERRRLFILEKN